MGCVSGWKKTENGAECRVAENQATRISTRQNGIPRLEPLVRPRGKYHTTESIREAGQGAGSRSTKTRKRNGGSPLTTTTGHRVTIVS